MRAFTEKTANAFRQRFPQTDDTKVVSVKGNGKAPVADLLSFLDYTPTMREQLAASTFLSPPAPARPASKRPAIFAKLEK
jgi:hypothetical protein